MNYCKHLGLQLNEYDNLRKRLQTNIYSAALIELGRLIIANGYCPNHAE